MPLLFMPDYQSDGARMNCLVVGLIGGFFIGMALTLFFVFKLNQWDEERSRR